MVFFSYPECRFVQRQVDASYPGLQIPQPEEHQILSYRLKVIKATRPEQYARKSTVKHAVPRRYWTFFWAYPPGND